MTIPIKKSKFTQELNEAQLEGVLATEGPVLVLAGAGSGKTRLLTYKIAYLVLELGIEPRSILGVTFTNKAAGEMRERVEQLCGGSLGGMWLGTFHAMCGKLLRIDGSAVGLGENYSIYDELDQRRLMKDIVHDFGLDPKEFDARRVLGTISSCKNRMICPEEYLPLTEDPKERTLVKLWTAYQDALKACDAVDFDDMLIFAVRLLQENDELRQKWARKFKYILVDEFQDTNLVQYELVKALASFHGNITVVGDDDQSIYSWRGAEVRNILDFPEDFEGTTTIRLEQNYRSTGNILEAASAVVANNAERHAKTLWTKGQKGELLRVFKLPDEYAEAKLVARMIREQIDGGVSGSDIAILYRVNAHSRLLEEALTRQKISHVIVGGIRFFDRAEIKDTLAYLRVVVNPDDDVAFGRSVNMPRRGVGLQSMNRLREMAKAEGKSLYRMLIEGDMSGFPPRSREGFAEYIEIIEELRATARSADAGEIVGQTLRDSGYLKMLEDDGSFEAKSRVENLSELLNSGIEFANTHPEDPSIRAYITEVSLLAGIDSYSPDEESVSLMTIHSAKGLEFGTVYVCGLEEGLFPIARAMESPGELEEERRLFYVAVTRAKERVALLWAMSRHRFGMEQYSSRSRFIDEIPKVLIEGDTDAKPEPSLFERKPSAKKAVSGAINPGTIVEHPFFGRGEVRGVQGWGENAILTVAFPKYGTKKLLLKYADLSVVRG